MNNLDTYIKEHGSCLICGGKLVRETITYTSGHHGRVVIIRNVPAYICSQCGEQLFAPETVEYLQNVIRHGKPEKTETVPVYEYPTPAI